MATVLITGASGVVGRAAAKLFDEEHTIGLVGTVHDVPEVDETIAIDLRAPRLGLADADWRSLAERVDYVVHSGALTTWGQPAELYRSVNIDGTRSVVELATAAGAPVVYVGTCFVHAIERGGWDHLGLENVVAPYIWSKLQAEAILAESGLPCTVLRPTNLVGDARTGASSRPQIVQALSDWICRGKAQLVPVHPGNRIDIVSLDVMAEAVVRTVRRECFGRMLWLTYGDRAMTVERSLDLLVEHAARIGRTIARPPVVDCRELTEAAIDAVPSTSKSFVKVLRDVSEATHWCGGVLPDSVADLKDLLDIELPSDEVAFTRSLQYWAAERGQLVSQSAEGA